jgi:hypothetical protein
MVPDHGPWQPEPARVTVWGAGLPAPCPADGTVTGTAPRPTERPRPSPTEGMECQTVTRTLRVSELSGIPGGARLKQSDGGTMAGALASGFQFTIHHPRTQRPRNVDSRLINIRIRSLKLPEPEVRVTVTVAWALAVRRRRRAPFSSGPLPAMKVARRLGSFSR